MRRWSRQLIVPVLVALGLSGAASATLGDPSSSSTSYRVVEGEIGGNGQFTSGSTSYNINPNVDDGGSSLGETTVGNSSSTSYQTNSGFTTTAQPGLTMVVNTGNVSLGTLSTVTANTATATFSVINYTSNGYMVQIIGTPPSNSGHALTALATDTASSNGTEQFGINLRANTSPVSVGADPVQTPSSTFSYGVAGDGITGTFGITRPYTIPNSYRYASGETIASAPKSSGQTDYTLSFMANKAALTPGGAYSGSMSIVATGTY
jgi:hypothetical protein